jgi:hypothetical protein
MSVREKPALSNRLLIFRFVFLFSLILTSSIRLPILARQITNNFLTRQKSPSSHASSDKSAIKVPFDLYGNNILVQVNINNSRPIWFVFDSGASINVINERTAKILGLTSKGSSTLDANGGMATGTFIEQTIINLAGVKASNQTIVAVPLDALAEYSGRDVQGLIGNNFIQNFVVEIDYAHRMLVFHNPQNYNLTDEPDAIVLENHDGNPFIKAEISLDGKDIITDSFEVDTGSNGIFSLNKPFADTNQILKVVPKMNIAEGAGGAGVGGELRTTNVRINSIKVGKYTLNKPVISILEDKNGDAANHLTGFLGSDLLRRFTVILDYQSQRILLKPNADFNEPFEVDLSGLELVTEANNYKVIKIKQVRANFPAAKAGLREGDIISVVNSRPAAEYGLDRLMKMFKRDGKEYRLIIKRDNKVISTKLKMKRVI